MSAQSWSWLWKSVVAGKQARGAGRRRRGTRRGGPPQVETLEGRILLAGHTLATATVPDFKPLQADPTPPEGAHVAGLLSSPKQVDLYKFHLAAGDQVTADVSAQVAGSGLESLLRIFDHNGMQKALDDQEGGDPKLTFQAATSDDYFVGISSAPNDNYDPTVADSGLTGATTGLYTLDLRLDPLASGVTPQADLTGSKFRLDATTSPWGESINGSFVVENRGGADAGAFDVLVFLANSNRLDTATIVNPAPLQDIPVAGLGAGQAFSSGSFPLLLPNADQAQHTLGFDPSGKVYLDLLIAPSDPSQDAGQFDKFGVHRGTDWEGLQILTPASASGVNQVQAGTSLLSTPDRNGAQSLTDLNNLVTGSLPVGAADLYQLKVPTTGRLDVRLEGDGGPLLARVSLYGSDGRLLISSEAGPGQPAVLKQHLGQGAYYLAVSGPASGAGYQLRTEFVAGSSPLQPLDVGKYAAPAQVVAADINGDGIPDLVVANSYTDTISVLRGEGDGTFAPQQAISLSSSPSPSAVAVADVNGDGIPDLVVASPYDSNLGHVEVLPGKGDGTFGAEQPYDVGLFPRSVAVADLNGDGLPDLVTANFYDGTVSVLLGNRGGGFSPDPFSPPALDPGTFPVGSGPRSGPRSVAVADVNGDGKPDLVVADEFDNRVSVLLGNGDGSFGGKKDPLTGRFEGAALSLAVGFHPRSVAVADVNGDGQPDLVVANAGTFASPDNTVSVLLGDGDGTFQPQQTFQAGNGPDSVAVADVNGDGRLDLVVANLEDNTVGVLLGNGDGTFGRQQAFQGGFFPDSVTVADLDGDGRPDLVTADYGTPPLLFGRTVGVLLGQGDGSFGPPQAFQATTVPNSVVLADVNGDGVKDLVVTNTGTGKTPGNTVGVLLGKGDGTFAPQQTFRTGSYPAQVVAADVNGDGVPDLVTANSLDDTVSVLLGLGNGSFLAQRTYQVGMGPRALAVADVNGDGILDLVVANYGDNTIGVLLGNGDGTFQDSPTDRKQHTFQVGVEPIAVTVADVNGDGKPDLVVVNSYNGTGKHGSVSVLLGNGNGTFGGSRDRATGLFAGPPLTFTVGLDPVAVAVVPLAGDGPPDLVVVNSYNGTSTAGTLSVLLGDGKGSFTFQPENLSLGYGPSSLALADVNGDRFPDLVLSYSGSGVGVSLGSGYGDFAPQQTFPAGSAPTSVAVGDVNGDGIPDLVVANRFDRTVSVLLGQGNESSSPSTRLSFSSSTPLTGVDLRGTPLAADLDGDGIPDSVILDRSGRILFRRGLPGPAGTFAPPVVLNPDRPARDLALVRTRSGWAVAAADAQSDPVLSKQAGRPVYTVSLYSVTPGGAVSRSTAFTTDILPERIAAANLNDNPNGLDDLVVASGLANSVAIAFQETPGQFGTPLTGSLTGSRGPSLVVPVGVAPSDIAFVPRTDQRCDIAVTDEASGDVAVLVNDPTNPFTTYRFRSGTGPSGLAGSTSAPVVDARSQPVALVSGAFTGSGHSDLVVINRGAHSFTVLPGDGQGGFGDPQPGLTTSTSDFDAGGQPLINDQPGPVVAGYFQGPNRPLDLAILMEDRGEVWIYTGHGDGTFTHTFSVAAGSQPTGLSVVRNAQTGFLDLLVGNPFGDVLRLIGNGDGTFRTPPPPRSDRVSVNVLEQGGNGPPEALVANQQADHVTIQAPQADGKAFSIQANLVSGPQGGVLAPADAQFFQPGGPGSPFPDAVVADSLGNEVLVYQGIGFDSSGTPRFAPTPQTYSVGQDPVAVTIADLNGDSIPDLLVADQGSNDVSVLFGSLVPDPNDPTRKTWVATPGPRLNSGGSGPIATTLKDMNGDGIPDLVVTNAQSNTLTVLPGIGHNGQGSGFFDAQSQDVRSIPLTGTPLPPPTPIPGGPILVPMANQIVALPPGAIGAPRQVFAAPDQVIDAVVPLPDGELVAALQGGVVELLRPNLAGAFVVAGELIPLDGVPANPRDLAVLEGPAGPEVLVTSAWEDQLFVFDLPGEPAFPPVPLEEGPQVEEGNPEGGPTAEELPPTTLVFVPGAENLPPSFSPGQFEGGSQRTQASEFQSLDNASLALIATLTTGAGEVPGEPNTEAAGEEGGFAVGVGSLPLSPTTVAQLTTAQNTGDEDAQGEQGAGEEVAAGAGDESPSEQAIKLIDFALGLKEALQLRNEKAEKSVLDGQPETLNRPAPGSTETELSETVTGLARTLKDLAEVPGAALWEGLQAAASASSLAQEALDLPEPPRAVRQALDGVAGLVQVPQAGPGQAPAAAGDSPIPLDGRLAAAGEGPSAKSAPVGAVQRLQDDDGLDLPEGEAGGGRWHAALVAAGFSYGWWLTTADDTSEERDQRRGNSPPRVRL